MLWNLVRFWISWHILIALSLSLFVSVCLSVSLFLCAYVLVRRWESCFFFFENWPYMHITFQGSTSCAWFPETSCPCGYSEFFTFINSWQHHTHTHTHTHTYTHTHTLFLCLSFSPFLHLFSFLSFFFLKTGHICISLFKEVQVVLGFLKCLVLVDIPSFSP